MHGDLSFRWKHRDSRGFYIHHIRQVATLLGYGEPQILEVLKVPLLQDYIGFYSH